MTREEMKKKYWIKEDLSKLDSWERIENPLPHGLIQECLNCNYNGTDYAENDIFNHEGVNDVFCPKCHSQDYFIKTEDEGE